MTRNQLELIKKGTYFFLVLGLGGSVLWLSSGGNVFQSDIINQSSITNINDNLNTNDFVTTGGLLNAVESTTGGSGTSISSTVQLQNSNSLGTSEMNTMDISSMNTNDSNIIYTSAPAASETNLNINTATSNTDDFADLVQTSYTGEESDLHSSAYTAEAVVPVAAVPQPVTAKPATQVVTATPAQAPQSGPEDIFLVLLALIISSGVMYYKKFLRTE
ncbi:MAG: hypothetical protein ACK4NC_02705 [Candidatus Gracilibacteria bacterium]